MEPLIFRGRLTEHDVAEFYRCYCRVIVRPWVRWTGCAVALLLGVLMVWYMIDQSPDILATLFLAGCLYWLFVWPRDRVWQARRYYRRHPENYLESEVRLSLDRVSLENTAIRLDCEWKLVHLIVEARSGLMFCNAARQPYFWLPSRLFEGNKGREQVLDIARSNGVTVRRI